MAGRPVVQSWVSCPVVFSGHFRSGWVLGKDLHEFKGEGVLLFLARSGSLRYHALFEFAVDKRKRTSERFSRKYSRHVAHTEVGKF